MSKRREVILVGLTLLAVVFFSLWKPAAFPVLAGSGDKAEQRVYDQANLFTKEEKTELEEKIRALRETMDMDLVLVTTDNALGKTSEEYADDFYDQGGFGIGSDHNGILYLIDMDNREVYLSTSGRMIRVLTDSRIENMLDEAVRHMGERDYDGCAKKLLAMTEQYCREGVPGGQYNYDRETGRISRYHKIRWYEAVLAVAVSAFCAGSVCLMVKREYGMERERKKASGYYLGYRANDGFHFRNRSDNLTNSFVNQRIIARSVSHSGTGRSSGSSHRSTTHRSGGGRSHGGGGRRF